MTDFTRRSFCTVTAAALLVPLGPLRASVSRTAVDGRGIAIDGYDTTAYWRDGAPKEGLAAHLHEWRGVPWHFATSQDAEMFAADPEKYAPQFGGFCTRAMSFKKIVNGDPQVWRIYGDHLYLFARPVGGEKFDEGQDAMIEKAQAYWDTLS
ncbi:MAG: YHS domain-containing (seleno)protein [Sulfitobacter sp.]